MSKDCEQCLQPSNNKFLNCAPRMNDGRNFTDYRPRCIANFTNLPSSVANNSYEYRQYMIKNADQIMKNNRLMSYEANRCGPCVNPYNEGTMMPEQTIQHCNKNNCTFAVNDVNGVGLGRKSDQTMSQNEFMKMKENEQKMLANMENCCATKIDDDQYYAFVYKQQQGIRPSIPSGGYPYLPSDRK